MMVSGRYKFLVVSALGVLVALCGVVLLPARAEAAVINEFPNASNSYHPTLPHTDVYASVAWKGDEDSNGDGTIDKSIGLEARVGAFRVFYKTSGTGATGRSSFDIRIKYACRPGFSVWNGDILVSLQQIGPDGTPSGNLPGRTNLANSGGNCSGWDMVMTVQRDELSWVPSYYGSEFQAIQVRVEKVTGIGTKWFRIISDDDGWVTFTEQTRGSTSQPGDPGYGTAFSVQATGQARDEREFIFQFSPDCQYVRDYGNIAYLKWFDADFDSGNELGTNNVTFTITRRVRGTLTIDWSATINNASSPSIGGDDDFREMQLPVRGPDDVFEWHWYNVNQSNGIQVWMPFSEMQENVTTRSGCDEPPEGGIIRADCSVISGWAIDPDRPNNAVEVVALVDGEWGSGLEIGRMMANSPDSDGRGNHGFSFPYDGPKDTFEHQVYIYAVGVNDSGVPTAGGPTLVTNPPITIPPCVAPQDFTLEPFVTSITFEDGESPGNVSIKTRVGPIGVPPPGIQATAIRYMTIIRNGGSTATTEIGSTTSRFTVGGQAYDDTYNTAPLNLVAGDVLCAHLYIYDTYQGRADIYGNVISVTQRAQNSSQICQKVVNKPYVKAMGGDVRAGGAFGVDGCVPNNPNATIKTFAKFPDGNPQAASGSSVEFAAFALGLIDGDTTTNGFYSAARRSGLPSPLKGLTFANDSADVWGGGFGAADHCITDFNTVTRTGAISPLPTSLVSSLSSGQYWVDQAGVNPIELLAPTEINNQVTIYAKGDVFLRNMSAVSPGFQYRSSGWSNPEEIPAFVLIVEDGNIYVDYNIAQLDGLYIAQPSTDPAKYGSTGMIYTCANPNPASGVRGPFRPVEDKARFFDSSTGCAKSGLLVNGALVARDIRMQRAVHTLREATPAPGSDVNAAEYIQYSPEIFLSQPALRQAGGPDSGNYDSISNLPPIF